MAQTIEMKCQRVGLNAEFCCDVSGRKTLGACLHKQAIGVEAIILRQSGKCGDSVYLFHISTNIEI